MTISEFNNNYWSYYIMLENKFIKTLQYVELCNQNFNTYSKEYIALIQNIGSELDLFFKIICDFNLNSRKTVKDYAEVLLTKYADEFKNQEIIIKNKDIYLTPFKKWNLRKPAKSLEWWAAYNDIKHNRVNSFKKATLKNTVNLLSALYFIEIKYLSEISKAGNEKDIPDIPSVLFNLKNWEFKWIRTGEAFFTQID